MNHDYVQENQIADLYLMGRLDDEDAALFEEHYLGCGECLERLELAEGFQTGLKQVAVEDVADAAAAPREAGREPIRRRYSEAEESKLLGELEALLGPDEEDGGEPVSNEVAQ